MFTLRTPYLLLTIVLFITEVLIALFVHDKFVRPYGGDMLVVMLIYCFVRAFFNVPVMMAAIGTLLFAFFVEGLQYINIVEQLGWQDNRLANTVIGNSFAWLDMVCYTVGVAVVLLVEKVWGDGLR